MKRAAVGLGLAAWGGLIAGGFWLWERYDSTPGPDGPPPGDRPASGSDYEVVMFVHPHCPCSRAGLAELAEATRRAGPNVGVRVAFVRPPGAGDGWERGELWDAAAALPGVRVGCDAGGAEARRAGATTAGHVVVYDAGGWCSAGASPAPGATGATAPAAGPWPRSSPAASPRPGGRPSSGARCSTAGRVRTRQGVREVPNVGSDPFRIRPG
jgi:hypothetical protein